MKLPAASGGVSSGIVPKPTRLRSLSFDAVAPPSCRAIVLLYRTKADHPCGKPQGILVKANKKNEKSTGHKA